MGEPGLPEPAGETKPPKPPWWSFLSQYFVPTAIASILASSVSVLTALNAAHEQQRDYNTKFESLVGNAQILDAFGGVYVADDVGKAYPSADAYKLARAKASYTQSVREQQAAATLVALQAVAESETQRRTVLLIGARLLNADPANVNTGSDAARLLTILIDEADRGRQSWNASERSLNARLWDTIDSPTFMDLVTSGYENTYYNDQYNNGDLRPYWPTLNGDAPISHDAKFAVLWKLTAPQAEGWVNLATFGYNAPRASGGKAGEVRNLSREANGVALQHHLENVGSVVGSLGRVVGVVAAGSCITVLEPLVPVLVFLPSYVVANQAAPPAGSASSQQFIGLVHMWAHVRATKDDTDC